MEEAKQNFLKLFLQKNSGSTAVATSKTSSQKTEELSENKSQDIEREETTTTTTTSVPDISDTESSDSDSKSDKEISSEWSDSERTGSDVDLDAGEPLASQIVKEWHNDNSCSNDYPPTQEELFAVSTIMSQSKIISNDKGRSHLLLPPYAPVYEVRFLISCIYSIFYRWNSCTFFV